MISLEHRQGTDQARGGKKHRQGVEGLRQCLADNILGPALQLAQAVPAPVHDAQRAGEKLGRNAHHRAHPHPEHGAWAAGDNSQRHTGNIAQTHGARQGGGEGLGVTQLAGLLRGIVTAQQYADRMYKVSVRQKVGIHGEKYATAHQQE